MKTVDAIDHFLLSRKAKGLSPRTIDWYRGILGDFPIRFPRLPKSPEVIERYLASLNVGDERRHGYYRALRCFFRFLARRYGAKNPVELVEPPKRKKKQPRILSPAEVNQLLDIATGYIKAAILFMIDTGARLGEYKNLTINDLHEVPDGFTCTITGKTGERIVPISYQTYHALMVTPRWQHSLWWLSREVSRAFKEAGMQGSALTLRHTFATLWQGEELVLQQIMGHSRLETTRMYRQLRTSLLLQQHNIYSPLKMVLGSSKSML